MNKIKFREVWESLGVNRTTALGWVHEILGWPKTEGTSDLYFSEKDYEKMWMIRFYKQLKYKNKKIENILNNPLFDMKKELEDSIAELTKERDDLNLLINVANTMLNSNITPLTYKFERLNKTIASEITYNENLHLIDVMSNHMFDIDLYDENTINYDQEEIKRILGELIQLIKECSSLRNRGYQNNAIEINDLIRKFHFSIESYISPYLWVFSEFTTTLLKSLQKIEQFADDLLIFVKEAVDIYKKGKDPYTEEIGNVCLKIYHLACKRNSFDSIDVQKEILLYCEYVSRIKIFNESFVQLLIKNNIELYNDLEYRKLVGDENDQGVCWFIANAFETFYENNFVNKNAKEEE